MIQQWAEMQACVNTNSLLRIVGARGSGKSCTAFAFACTLARAKWDVLWMHYSAQEMAFDAFIHQYDMVPQLDKLLRSTTNATVLIFDAKMMSSEAVKEAHLLCKLCRKQDKHKRRLVWICVAGSFSTMGENMEFQLALWTIEEYITAVQHDAFFDHVKRLFSSSDATREKRVELVKAKYFAAGGNSRLMFGSTTDVAIKSL
uniref:ATPase AAA-type core domain-containing protein n=1 Tax=Globisporangium ultimum (strain ATCC 200006 / CBS 805.95 / DAOM BR144) TaxID=431595 RepID=K3X0K0_GLOUD